jgi:hypothetical protein
MEEKLMSDQKLSWQQSCNEARAGRPFDPFKHSHSGFAAGIPAKAPAITRNSPPLFGKPKKDWFK